MSYFLGNDTENPFATYKYSYDSNGNITDVWENNVKIAEYEYDSLNQLKECADKTADKYFVYNYDNNGNITSIDIHSLVNGLGKGAKERTDSYSYSSSGWKDQLVSYKNDSITYDNIGNPTSYRDGMTMSWTGRELQSITKGNDSYSFTYNLNGLRTKKNVNGTNTFYYYDDSNNLIGLKKGNTTVLFYYDQNGQVYSMTVGDDTYFFIKNLQGDVTKIIDENGDTCATYAYDAWGALLAENEDSSIEGLNPFRYRGYVYDKETALYYLQSRYYDPKTGRFINADSPVYTDTYSGSPLSTNMFAYCENNAANCFDFNGLSARKLRYPGEVHRYVQDYIASKYKMIKEAYIVYKNGKTGRADLLRLFLDSKKKIKGEIWEIKPLSTKASVAESQLNKYINGKWKNKGIKNASKIVFQKGGTLPRESFIKGDLYITFYSDAKVKGLIRYTYSDYTAKERLKVKVPELQYDKNIIIILLGICTMIVNGGAVVLA